MKSALQTSWEAKRPFRISFLGWVILFKLSLSTDISAQSTYSTAALLTNQPQTTLDSLAEKNRYFLQYGQGQLSFVDEIDLRTETDEWTLARQEYLLRFGFNNKSMQRAQQNIARHNMDLFELRMEKVEEDRLALRYEYLTDWYKINSEIDLLNELKIILEDKIVVLRKMLNNSLDVNLDDLLKAQERVRELDQDLLNLESEKEFVISQLIPEGAAINTAELDTSSWITFETMHQVIEEWKQKPVQNTDQHVQAARIKSAQLELDEEKAEQKQVIDFVQLKYSGRDNLDFHQEWTLGMGLKFPTKSNSQQRLNEAYQEKFEETFKAQLLAEETEQKLEVYYSEFQRFLNQRKLVQEQIKSADLQTTYNRLLRVDQVNPLSLLRIRESMLLNAANLIEIENDARDIYLKIIEFKGLIALAPINFLSENLQIIN